MKTFPIILILIFVQNPDVLLEFVNNMLNFCWYYFDADTAETASNFGYQSENHFAVTEDGYILRIFRICSKTSFNISTIRPPIFLQHGLMCSSNSFASLQNRSLAYRLADLGFDVWIGNLRGTTYSKQHIYLSPKIKEFWDFSSDDMIQDVRAMLKYVANVTRTKKSIIYVGHSLGAFLMTGFALEYPEEAENLVKGTIFLAPAVYLSNSKRFSDLSRILPPLLDIAKYFGKNKVFFYESFVRILLTVVSKLSPDFGNFFIKIINGPSKHYLNEDLLLIWKNYLPSSSSINILIQFYQNYWAGKCQKFDHEREKNLEVYQSEQPPLYNLTKYKLPTYIFYGQNDVLVDTKDCLRFYNEIGSTQKYISSVPVNSNADFSYGHIDFVISKEINKYLHDDLVLPAIMERLG